MEESSLQSIAQKLFHEQPHSVFLPATAQVTLTLTEALRLSNYAKQHAVYYQEHSRRADGFNQLTFKIGREIMEDLADILVYWVESASRDQLNFRPSKVEVPFICDMIALGECQDGGSNDLFMRLKEALKEERSQHCLLDHILSYEYIQYLLSTCQTRLES